jgi:dynein assembly factor 5
LRLLDRCAGGALYARHAGQLLASAAAEAASWPAEEKAGGPAFFRTPVALAAVSALLLAAPPAALRPHAAPLAAVFARACDPRAGAAMQRAALQLLDEALEARQSDALLCLAPALPSLLADALLPPLAWRAGRPAAAVRYSACVCVATLLRTSLQARGDGGGGGGHDAAAAAALADARPALLTALQACLEDEQAAEVRRAAAHGLHLLARAAAGPLDADQALALAAAAAARLDDGAAELRVCGAELAADAVRAAAAAAPEGPTAGGTDYVPLLAALLLHCDDADAAVRAAAVAAATLLVASRLVQPSEATRAARAAREAAIRKDVFDDIIEAASGGTCPPVPDHLAVGRSARRGWVDYKTTIRDLI